MGIWNIRQDFLIKKPTRLDFGEVSRTVARGRWALDTVLSRSELIILVLFF
jgi:hypothetical protein